MMHQRRFVKEFEEEAIRQVQTSGRTTARGAIPPVRRTVEGVSFPN